MLYMSLGRYQDAETLFQNYRIPDSNRSRNLLRRVMRAELTLLDGDPAAAAELGTGIARSVVESSDRSYLKEYDARAELLTGSALRLASRPEQALPHLQQAVELASDLYDKKQSVKLAQAQIVLAQCYLDLKKPTEARNLFEQARAIHQVHKTVAP